MRTMKIFIIGTIAVLTVGAAVAQDRVPGLQDLIGARGGDGEYQMERRGYTWVRTEKSGGDAYSYWRENENGQCVTVRTSDGRYASIVYAPDFDCRNEGNRGGSHDSYGSSYGNATHRVTCESRDGRREHCRAETNRGVQLVDRLSSSSCEQGRDWGYDNIGIWVDNGCRAVFEVGGGHAASHGYQGSSTSTHRVTCESSDNGRAFCRTNTSGGVRLANRLSKSGCEQGRDWGWDRDGIWVDNGCRAVFEVGGGHAATHGYQGSSSSTHRITCESSDNRREYCRTNTSGGVRLADRLSKSGCEQGRDWGWDRDGIWVDNGCRAVFEVGGGHSPTYGYQGSSSSTHRVTCESSDNRREYCRTNTSGGVRLADRLSKSGCEQGRDWGWDRDGIWVDNGCRAVFEVGGGY